MRCVVWVTAGADRRDTLIQRRGGALMRTGAWLEAGTREAKPKVNGERLKGRTADVNRLLELQKRTKASKANEGFKI